MEKKAVKIRSVWRHNAQAEFCSIERCLASGYRLISMDTEFPGTIYRSSGEKHYSQLTPRENYQLMKANVDALNLIQVGITLSDPYGNLPDLGTDSCYIWEFNISDFDVLRDPCNRDSIELLKSQGIDFHRNRNHGLDSGMFASLLGRHVLDPNHKYNLGVTWITFHGSSDFAYLIKALTQRELPDTLGGFMGEMGRFFGLNVFDAKHMAKYCKGLYGGLEKISGTLGVERIAGKGHQAGSDSLLTLQCFLKVFEKCVRDKVVPPLPLKNVLYGLEAEDLMCSRLAYYAAQNSCRVRQNNLVQIPFQLLM